MSDSDQSTATANKPLSEIGYHSIQILKSQTLGIGSYGSVYKAKCDDLICAAKVLHPTLFDPRLQQLAKENEQHRLPFRRFQQECEYLSALKHPNIVQYLGTFQDPDSKLPVLLMELLDCSLTSYLESIHEAVPYHTQVNFCHDIAKALSFLHNNGITHRDLSSNNILLISNVRAKVSDFGMATLSQRNSLRGHTGMSYTMCPGTDVYMPPEAIGDKPIYTEKIDCFSFGVILIQILARKFPDPDDRLKTVRINHPQYPVIEVRVSEVERRQRHIDEIERTHPLLMVALDCLKDADSERPSAHELCESLESLKQDALYVESKKRRNGMSEPQEWIDSGSTPDTHAVEELQEKLKESQKQVKKMEKILKEKEKELKKAEEAHQERQTGNHPVTIDWKRLKNAPFRIVRGPNAISDGAIVYLRPAGMQAIYAYNTISESWTDLPDCGDKMCSIAIVNHLVTAIGGRNLDGTSSNKLLSLTKIASDGKWMALYPPMPTSRAAPTTVCKCDVLVVAGGIVEDGEMCSTIEVMDTNALTWTRVIDAPQRFFWGTIKMCRDHMYLLGGWNTKREQITEVFSYPLGKFFAEHNSRSLGFRKTKVISGENQDQTSSSQNWQRVADLPVTRSTCIEVNGCLLSIGGIDLENRPVTSVYMYIPSTNNWQVIGNKLSPTCWCIASDCSGNKIVTFGGYAEEITPDKSSSFLIENASNKVEIATFSQ